MILLTGESNSENCTFPDLEILAGHSPITLPHSRNVALPHCLCDGIMVLPQYTLDLKLPGSCHPRCLYCLATLQGTQGAPRFPWHIRLLRSAVRSFGTSDAHMRCGALRDTSERRMAPCNNPKRSRTLQCCTDASCEQRHSN